MQSSCSWKKHGVIFQSRCSGSWNQSHAALPVTIPIDEAIFRVFYASRDERQRSHIGYFDFDVISRSVVSFSEQPVLYPGGVNKFAPDGIYASSAVWENGTLLLYVIGWERKKPAPLFSASVGLALSSDNGKTFDLYSENPILSPSNFDHSLVTAPTVFKCEFAWHMLYVSDLGWSTGSGGTPNSRYHVKYARSDNGIEWEQTGLVSIDFKDASETNISRVGLIREGGRFHAWFGTLQAERRYVMGYARSVDGVRWERNDALAGIGLSEMGWDSKSISYPNLFRYGNTVYMLYNGNDFGRTGIGLASLPVSQLELEL